MQFFRILMTALVVSLLLGTAGAAAAQENNSSSTTATATPTPTPDPTDSRGDRADDPDNSSADNSSSTSLTLIEQLDDSDDCEAPQAIDDTTVLCSSTVENGDAVLVLRSDYTQRVTVTDAGAFMAGGEVPRKKATLREGERNTVRIPVTRHNGFAGVSVDTGSVLFAVPLEEQSTLIGGPWTKQDVTVGALAGAASVAFISIIVVIRAVTGRSEKPERLA